MNDDRLKRHLDRLGAWVDSPCTEHPGHEDKAGFPPDWASQIDISCSP